MVGFISHRDFLKDTAAGALCMLFAGSAVTTFAEEKELHTPGTSGINARSTCAA